MRGPATTPGGPAVPCRTVPSTPCPPRRSGRGTPRAPWNSAAAWAVALPLSAGPGRGLTLGALVLLYTGPDPLTADVLALAQSFADAAGYTLARDREIRQSRALADQLGHALKSRVVIEQAKGVLAARRKVSVDDAFAVLRAYARSQQRRLAEVARDVVDGQLDLGSD